MGANESTQAASQGYPGLEGRASGSNVRSGGSNSSNTSTMGSLAANEKLPSYLVRIRERLSKELTPILAKMIKDNDGYGGGVLRIEYGTDGIPLYNYAIGTLSAEVKSDPIVPGSLIEIASCTKLIVACAIAQLVENGSLSYTTTLGDLFRLGEKFPIPAGMLVIDGKDYSSYITIQALLSHRSGLVDYWTDPNRDGDKSTGKDNAFLTAFNKDPQRLWTAPEILSYVPRLQLPPRVAKKLKAPSSLDKAPVAKHLQSFYHYSDTNYVILAIILEHFHKAPLAKILNDTIFVPLRMQHTFMSYTNVLPEPSSSPESSMTSTSKSTPSAPATTAAGPEQVGSSSPESKSSSTTTTPTTPCAPVALASSSSSSKAALFSQSPRTVPASLHKYLAHRYEHHDSLIGEARQSADWGGGGLVSTTQDMCTFMRSVFLAKPGSSGAVAGGGSRLVPPCLFKKAATLKSMQQKYLATGEGVSEYAYGMFRIDTSPDEFDAWEDRLSHPRLRAMEWEPEEEDWVIWGHGGHGNSFMYAWPKAKVVVAGSLNNTRNEWWPLVEKMIEIVVQSTLIEGVIFFDTTV